MGMVLLLVAALAYWVGLAVSAALDARRADGTRLGRGRWLAVAGLLVVQVALGALPIRSWLPVRAFRIPSGSMGPALQVGDRLIADMRAWNRHEPRRGDLVIHRVPERAETYIVRRVIGLPGESVEIRDKRVYVEGEPIEDPWATHSIAALTPTAPSIHRWPRLETGSARWWYRRGAVPARRQPRQLQRQPVPGTGRPLAPGRAPPLHLLEPRPGPDRPLSGLALKPARADAEAGRAYGSVDRVSSSALAAKRSASRRRSGRRSHSALSWCSHQSGAGATPAPQAVPGA